MKAYSHLSAQERIRIDELRNREGLGVCQIALRIGRDKSTVSVFCQVGVGRFGVSFSPWGGGDVLLDFVVCMVVGQCTGWFQATSPSLRRPKNPSAAALSGEQPFALIDRVSPCSVQMRIHSGHR